MWGVKPTTNFFSYYFSAKFQLNPWTKMFQNFKSVQIYINLNNFSMIFVKKIDYNGTKSSAYIMILCHKIHTYHVYIYQIIYIYYNSILYSSQLIICYFVKIYIYVMLYILNAIHIYTPYTHCIMYILRKQHVINLFVLPIGGLELVMYIGTSQLILCFFLKISYYVQGVHARGSA